jgi:N-methylhydantoinase A
MLLGVDVGGTFTDAVLIDGSSIHTAKVPSTPADQAIGVIAAIEAVLTRAKTRPERIARFAHGMTVTTNALLEGGGARTAMIATEGFGDVVELGRQARPSLYRLWEASPAPLVPRELRFAAPERMSPQGPVRNLDKRAARALVEQIALCEPEAIAVTLLHSYAHPEHELLLGEILEERLPGVHISLSHQLVGTFREYERAATTEVDAALSPLLGSYLRNLSARTRAGNLPEPEVMQSSGGLTDSATAARHAALTVLSGPAGGVAGALLLAGLCDEPNVLCFDMGGTSCDVCLIEDSQVAETAQRTVAGRPLALAALDIHTVGAGGGSIAWRDRGGALRVGPRSAGALPGPACYGRGGSEPTVTDANLLLGRLLEDAPLAGGVTLDVAAAEGAVAALAGELGLSKLQCAEGIVRVAEAEMLCALRVVTVQRGIDPRRFTLMPFGGAGPLHALALAEELGIERVLCPQSAGVLCALGLAAAPPRRDLSRTVMLYGAELNEQRVAQERERLLGLSRDQLGSPPTRERVSYEFRYRGQSFELAIEEPHHTDPGILCEAFACAHEERYGYREDDSQVELVTIRVSVWAQAPEPRPVSAPDRSPEQHTRHVVLRGDSVDAVCLRGELESSVKLVGPMICALGESTLLVRSGWSGTVDRQGTIHLTHIGVIG